MTPRSRIGSAFAARDPGRARLTVAIGVAVGAAASAAVGMLIVKEFHADGGLLAMSVFLSVMAGNMVRDRSATGRVVTTALMIPAVLLAIVVAAALSSNRLVVIGVFVVLSGVAIWVRRFGPRAGALGSLSFMGYFFTLFMKPTLEHLPVFCLIGACAIATQLVVRSLMLLKRPRPEIDVLLKELRAASASALRATSHTDHRGGLRAALARVDDVARAITAWQQHFPTDRYVACDEGTLAARVLDARVDTEEACYELARGASPGEPASEGATSHARAQLRIILDERASAEQLAAAKEWAEGVIARGHRGEDGDFAAYLLARSTIAHMRVREIDLSHGLVHDGRRVKETSSPAAAKKPAARPALHWVPWSQWQATSRMAVQAMIAAALACAVGEAISASRWYWAVMTAFVIFIGASTRSGILTRAYRRVAGTALGIVVGVVPVILADHNKSVMIAICVVSVFCMLYFGPLNYVYSAFSLTVMLVALYGLLGVLDTKILELRLIETLSGAVIGVVCAYLIGSTNSRPVLITKVNAYFDALDAVLKSVSAALGTTGQKVGVLSSLRTLEATQADVDLSVSGMAAAFRISGAQRESTAVHLMYVITRSAARLTQSVVTPESSVAPETHEASAQIVDDAISTVTASAANARRAICEPHAEHDNDPDRPAVVLALDQLPPGASTAASAAIMALARIDWALRRISDDTTGGTGRHSEIPTVAALPA